MKKLYYLIVLTLILGLILTGCSLLSNVGQVPTTEQSGISYLTKGVGDALLTVRLMAGRNTEVGTVTAEISGTDLVVTYDITVGNWEITETHLYVGKTDPKLYLTSAPGQFPYFEPLINTPTSHTYTIPIEDIDSYSLIKGKKWVPDGDFGVGTGDKIYIAAHAEVEKTESTPRYPSGVSSYEQGLRLDGTDVVDLRSIPEQGLVYELAKVEASFFSLGYGGCIIVEFDCPIPNGDGDDIRIIEDTWSSYPLETAEVSASQDGITWVVLGTADNTPRVGIHSFSIFDLGSLDWAKYIKVFDTTNYPSSGYNDSDGFDLNAVEALQDCIQEETAWALGTNNFGTNWATYFTYTIPIPCPEPVLLNGSFEYPDVTNLTPQWDIYLSSEVDWTVNWADIYPGAPIAALLELHGGVNGWSAYVGAQYAELDTDWEEPSGEQASVEISQMVNTCDCKYYKVTFSYSPRPGHPDNGLTVYWNGIEEWTITVSGAGLPNTVWTMVTISNLQGATGATETELKFVETGTADSLGMFLDDVSVEFYVAP